MADEEMLQIKKLLFPVDFSARCLGAAPYVLAFAGRFQSELTLLHVVDRMDYLVGGIEAEVPLPLFDARRERLQSAESQIQAFLGEELTQFDVKRLVLGGDPAREVVDYALRENVDLIMIPSQGYGVFRRYVIGSTAAKVLHDAHCPVWTSAHTENSPPLESIAFRKVVCAIDLGPESERALAWAAGFAGEHAAELIAVHAIPEWGGPQARSFGSDLAQVLIGEARQQAEALILRVGCHARTIVESGTPANVVRSVGEREQADLTVIARGSAAEGLGRLRTHAYAIIRDSPCPVISV